jgi:hypothetical protein
MWQFNARRPFKASLVGADLPVGQTVIAAINHGPTVEIQAGEVLFSTVKDVHDAGTTVTLTRKDMESKCLYRADGQTFWASVVERLRSGATRTRKAKILQRAATQDLIPV